MISSLVVEACECGSLCDIKDADHYCYAGLWACCDVVVITGAAVNQSFTDWRSGEGGVRTPGAAMVRYECVCCIYLLAHTQSLRIHTRATRIRYSHIDFYFCRAAGGRSLMGWASNSVL